MNSIPHTLTNSLRRHPFVWAILAVSFLVFLLMLMQGVNGVSNWFIPSRLEQLMHMPWRAITPVFIHYTFFHFVSNAVVWWYFGSRLEERSRRELILVFVIGALAGNVAQWLYAGPNFGGLSGVTYALMAYCWGVSYLFKTKTLRLDNNFIVLMLVFMVVSATGLIGNYANAAHFFGLLSGCILAISKHTLNKLNRG